MTVWVLVTVSAATMILNVVLLVKMLLVLDQLRSAAEINATVQTAIQAHADVVAKDLADRYVRADAVEGQPGEAADMAARSEPEA